ncbi:unnamed protein product [Cuscuta campestris]|uniref:DUF8039 domain-containing protein n=1 Tax=Cuscuta campestris TaxID=132261 RepID=A0A484MA40_9ASTE|nr:unnamed protein product [Cuscuta campestris]
MMRRLSRMRKRASSLREKGGKGKFGRGKNPTGYQPSRLPVHTVVSLPAPPRSRESYSVQDAPKYCKYHRNSTHNTLEWVMLKELDQLIARGPPPRPEWQASGNRTWRRPAAAATAITNGEGQEDGRRYLGRDCENLDEEERKNKVHLAELQRPPPERKKKEPLIFTDEDYPPVLSPHRDALVVKVKINNVVVHRTRVDTCSSVNIMYNNTFKELGLSRGDLKPIRTPLSGLPGHTIEAEGTITVKVGVGDGTHRLLLDMEFMARIDENVSTICAAIQKEEGRPRAEVAEEVQEVALDPAKPEQKVKVGDMPDVDPRIICHRLAVDPAYKTVKQKKRFLSSERRYFATKEVTTLEEQDGSWRIIYTDGSSATDASGGGVVAISPEGFQAYYSIRFRFRVLNNEAEYEALLCGLREVEIRDLEETSSPAVPSQEASCSPKFREGGQNQQVARKNLKGSFDAELEPLTENNDIGDECNHKLYVAEHFDEKQNEKERETNESEDQEIDTVEKLVEVGGLKVEKKAEKDVFVDVDSGESQMAQLDVGSVDNIVAHAKVYGFSGIDDLTLHGEKMGEQYAKVSITEAIQDVDVPVPIPGEVFTVEQAKGTFVTWHKELIVLDVLPKGKHGRDACMWEHRAEVTKLADRFKGACDGQHFLIPFNDVNHWALTFVKPNEEVHGPP